MIDSILSTPHPPDIVSNSQHLTDIILSSMKSTPSIFHKSLASIFTASAEAMNKSKVKELLIKLGKIVRYITL